MKKRLAFIGLAVGTGLSIWAYAWWHGGASTSVVTIDDQAQTSVLGNESKLINWQTVAFSTRYPDFLRVITSNEVTRGNTKGQYLLGAVSLKQNDQLAVTVGKLDAMRLEELPAIKLRRVQTETYREITRSFTPSGGLVFGKSDGFETGVFWSHGDDYAAVVVSGSSARQAELEDALENVVTNWQWR